MIASTVIGTAACDSAEVAPDATLLDAAPPSPDDVHVVITADNAYSFGYGTVVGIQTFFQGSRASLAGEIFNCGTGPEAYLVPAAAASNTAYLYVVAWDDYVSTQGVLAQFRRIGGDTLYTGDERFEVCATGISPADAQRGPSELEINAQISICNAGLGDPDTTSAGWVNASGARTAGAIGVLDVGERNSEQSGAYFPPACPTGSATTAPTIDGDARWMWYAPRPGMTSFRATGANTFRAFLIFRVAATDVPPVD